MSNLKNNRWLSIATIVLLVANIVTLVILWNNKSNSDHQRPPGSGAVFEFLTKELQLDSMQQQEYKKLRDAHQASQRQMQDSTRKAKDAFFSLLQQPAVNDSLLQEYSRKATTYDQQMDIITFKHFQQVRALCRPDQQKKFDAIIQDVLRRMPGPRKGPPPGGPGERPGNFPPPPGNGEEPPPPQQ